MVRRTRAAVLFVLVLATAVLAQERTMGLLYCDSAAVSPGYTLLAPLPYTMSYLIDNDGMLVHSWQGTRRPGFSVSLCEDGRLLRTCYTDNEFFRWAGAGGRVELVDWDGNVSWSYDYSSNLHCQHHDAIRLPNGNVLMIAWEYKSRAEAIAAGRHLFTEDFLWPDHLLEIDPESDSLVWEWHAWDHLVQDYDSTKANYGDPQSHPELIDLNYFIAAPWADWLHSNSVSYNPELDQVVVSVRHFSEVWILDHSTTTAEAAGHAGGRYGRGGDLLYRWGNPAAYRRGGTIGQTLYWMHDAGWIPESLPGAGHMLVFNNGVDRPPRQFSSVDEFVPPTDSAGWYHLGPDSAYGPAAPVWRYMAMPPERLYSDILSGCQRMPNGNTLICVGYQGMFIEVTADQRLVWEYINPVGPYGPMEQGEYITPGSNQVFAVRRYSSDYPGLEGRNLEPQGPIERYPQAVAEGVSAGSRRLCPAAVRGQLVLSGVSPAGLLDIGGREVARLRPGVNDIRSVPAGVYFVRPGASMVAERVVVQR